MPLGREVMKLLSKSSEYWKKSMALYDAFYEEIQELLGKEYLKSAERAKDKIVKLYEWLLQAQKDGTVLISDLYKYDKYYKTIEWLNKEAKRLGEKELVILEDFLSEMYKKNSLIIGKQFSLISFSEESLRIALTQVWCNDGMTWSQRIWNNKSELVRTVKDGLVDCVSRGVPSGELAKTIVKKFDVSYYQAKRLAATELTHIQVKSDLDKYKEAGIQFYKVIHEDPKGKIIPCEVCKEIDQQIFPVTEQAIPNLTHPFCRGATIAILDCFIYKIENVFRRTTY